MELSRKAVLIFGEEAVGGVGRVRVIEDLLQGGEMRG